MTDEDLRSLCTYWQKVLRLQDWDVVIKFRRIFDMQPGTMGTVDWTLETKKAIVNILEPTDFSNNDFEFDVEEVVVHELLHLHFCDKAEENNGCPISVEQGIDALAGAFVKLNREAKESTSSKQP